MEERTSGIEGKIEEIDPPIKENDKYEEKIQAQNNHWFYSIELHDAFVLI